MSKGKLPIYLDHGSQSEFYQWTRKLIGQVDFFGTCLKDRSKNVVFPPKQINSLELYVHVLAKVTM